MTARSIGAIVGSPRRSYQPVRRNSRHAGERELEVWRAHNVFGAEQRRTMVTVAKAYDRQHKLPGKVLGPLGRVAIDVLDELLGMRDFKTGRLDPALDTIARALRVSKQTVVSALKRLKSHGFLDWYRRTRPVDTGDGRTVEQDTNAYWFKLPKWADDRVRAILARPTPACAAAHARQHRDDVAEMLRQAGPEGRIDFHHGSEGGDAGDLASALRALQRSVSKVEVASPATGLNPGREVK